MIFRHRCQVVFCGLAVACSAPEDSEKAAGAPRAPAAPTSASQAAAVDVKPTAAVRGIARPLKTGVTGLALMDRVDVGNEADERAHGYTVKDPTFRGAREFELQPNAAYVEDGRAMKTYESFSIKVAPGAENILVKAFDTLAKDQKVRVLVEGTPVGEWALPDGGSSRYGEAKFALPASLIGTRQKVQLKLEYVSGAPDTNAFVYWVYAQPEEKLVSPVGTDIVGLKLTDRLDVGADADEAEHQYIIDKASYSGVQQFESPRSGRPFLENGRATKSYEAFRMKVTPSKNHVLVKAFDTYSKNQVVRVLVEGAVVGDWSMPDGAPRYGETTFKIPAKFIGARDEVNVRIEFVSASVDTNSFHYWMFAEPEPRNG